MRTEPHVLTLCGLLHIPDKQEQSLQFSSFQEFSCKHLQIIWVLSLRFYTEIKVKPETGKSENLLLYLCAGWYLNQIF